MDEKELEIPKKLESTVAGPEAQAINALIDLVTDLQARVDALEAGQADDEE